MTEPNLATLKPEMASLRLRITGLEYTLRDVREQLIKAREALGRGHALEAECNRQINRAWHLLNFDNASPSSSTIGK